MNAKNDELSKIIPGEMESFQSFTDRVEKHLQGKNLSKRRVAHHLNKVSANRVAEEILRQTKNGFRYLLLYPQKLRRVDRRFG